MVELRSQNQHLLGINSELAAGQEELAKELKAVDFLRLVAWLFGLQRATWNIECLHWWEAWKSGLLDMHTSLASGFQ
jgi:hypothetical protein